MVAANPRPLAGEAMAWSARLLALADVDNALISRRTYKIPLSHEEAIEIINAGRGKHVDPDIADAGVELAGMAKKNRCQSAISSWPAQPSGQ